MSRVEEISVYPIMDAHDLCRIPDLEMAIWGNRDPVPPSLLKAFVDHGGEVSVAARRDHPKEWIGFSMSFRGEGTTLYSHQTGVLPGYQGRGVGRALKRHQNQWAYHHQYRAIVWTFDPLRAMNAYFNIAVLGAEVVQYLPNYYGTLTSRLNQGLPSDRLLVRWAVPAPPVVPTSPPQDATLTIDIVDDLDALKAMRPHQAAAYQDAVRRQFMKALASGYQVIGFQRLPHPAYLLKAP
jgi:predicted GNAT superfamily acetyltransferase